MVYTKFFKQTVLRKRYLYVKIAHEKEKSIIYKVYIDFKCWELILENSSNTILLNGIFKLLRSIHSLPKSKEI